MGVATHHKTIVLVHLNIHPYIVSEVLIYGDDQTLLWYHFIIVSDVVDMCRVPMHFKYNLIMDPIRAWDSAGTSKGIIVLVDF